MQIRYAYEDVRDGDCLHALTVDALGSAQIQAFKWLVLLFPCSVLVATHQSLFLWAVRGGKMDLEPTFSCWERFRFLSRPKTGSTRRFCGNPGSKTDFQHLSKLWEERYSKGKYLCYFPPNSGACAVPQIQDSVNSIVQAINPRRLYPP